MYTLHTIRETWIGSGLQAGQKYLGLMRSWGCVVGKKEALKQFDAAVSEFGLDYLSHEICLSVNSVKKLRKFYESLPDEILSTPSPYPHRLVFNEAVIGEEDREYEFKEIKGNNPRGSIQNTVDEYAVSFMNSQGGSIFWGIRNHDRKVVGLTLTFESRDDIRKAIWNKLIEIQPAIDPSAFKIHFHEVFRDGDQPVADLCVLEVITPKMDGKTLYFTGGNEAFVRVDGIKKKLIGPEIQDWILRRNQTALVP